MLRPPQVSRQCRVSRQAARLSPEQLQELVAPIALYPDALVAQILAASAYPTQIVEAERFLQQNPNLKGAALGSRSGQARLGPEREGFDAVSFRACRYGQEPFVDV